MYLVCVDDPPAFGLKIDVKYIVIGEQCHRGCLDKNAVSFEIFNKLK
jgi:hypothetical protein